MFIKCLKYVGSPVVKKRFVFLTFVQNKKKVLGRQVLDI